MIYLDNAATTLHKPACMIEAVVKAMQEAGNASRGAHRTSLAASRIVYEARARIAAFFHCTAGADHVIFTANATEALNTVLNGLFNKGDHVITTDLEHNSVLRPLYRLEEAGIIELSFVKADEKGCIDLSDFACLRKENTKAIVCTHASNLTGNMIDLASIPHEGILLIADASQTAGCVPIDMEKMGIDILCFTGHKGLMGPQGTGGFCMRDGVEIRPWKVGGSGIHSYDRHQPDTVPEKLEAGTLNVHGIAGLSASVNYIAETGIEKIAEKERLLAKSFYEGVKEIEEVTVYGDFSKERTAIVTLNIRDEDSAVIADELSEYYDIAVRAGAHCAPRMHEALGTVKQGAVRFSFSWFNDMNDVLSAVKAVKELAE